LLYLYIKIKKEKYVVIVAQTAQYINIIKITTEPKQPLQYKQDIHYRYKIIIIYLLKLN